jgi:hypothetical protein
VIPECHLNFSTGDSDPVLSSEERVRFDQAEYTCM